MSRGYVDGRYQVCCDLCGNLCSFTDLKGYSIVTISTIGAVSASFAKDMCSGCRTATEAFWETLKDD